MNQHPHPAAPPPAPYRVGRYMFFGEIASGGMATVHLARMTGQAGFSKTVAIKRPHPHLVSNPEFARMIVDEARLAARIQHPNVVATLDCVAEGGELFLVMDYIHGESLGHLLTAAAARGLRTPPAVIGSIIVNILHGLHAAHEATDELGRPLGIVHRDVSPQNVLVGVDGVARVLDFGVAKATGRLQSTQEGQLKGKFAYMAPEQITGAPIDRRTDIYAASALLWGALAGRRLIEGRSEAELLNNVIQGKHLFPSSYAPEVTPQMDHAVMRGLASRPEDRYATAREMAMAIEAAVGTVSPFQIAEWVKSLAAEAIALRSARILEMESASDVRVSMRMGVAEIVQASAYEPTRHPGMPGSGGYPAIGNAPAAHASSRTPPPYVPTTPGIYVSAGAEVEKPDRSIATLVGVAALVFAVTFGGTLYWRYGAVRNEAPPSAAATAAPTASTAMPVTSVTNTETPPVVPVPPVVQPGIPLAPTTTTTTAPTTPATTSTTAPTAHPSGTTTATPKGTASAKPVVKKGGKASCEASPFYVDADGIKQVRPECM